MKFRLGIRSSVVILFLGLYLTSLIVLNSFFINKQKQTNQALRNIRLDEALSELTYKTEKDSARAKTLLNSFRESLAATGMIQSETQIYSAVFLFLLMIFSICIFVIIFYIITKPLKELQIATANIREGNFSIFLPETGIKEIKELKQSFNSMSNELNNVQQKLIKAEKEMIWKELSRILAHEIKNPLTPIQLSIQRLEEKFETDPEKFQEIFDESVLIINQEINNLQKLAKSFSNFAKNIIPEFTIFNPSELIKKIIKPYSHTYDIQLEGEKNIKIRFDQTHFYQVITNILQNAIDVSSKEDLILIKLEEEEYKLIIKIIDQGKGIPEEDINRIFEPYFTKKKKGTGLGLALVKKIIDINKADIRVKSEVNKGSTFEIIMEYIR